VNDTGLVLASSTATNPVQRTTALDGQPDWSPDATKLVFGRGRPNALAQDVWRVNADGTGLKQLTFAGNDGDPAWSPDGTRIAYFSPTPNTNGKLGIWVMNPDGTGQTELTPTSLGFARSPTWSPDSTRIAFACSAGSVTEVCTMNADGSGLVHLTGPQSVIDVAWSRDGTTLAFAASGPSGPGLYAIHPDGTGLVLLRAGRPDTSVSWSPDSRKIAFDATPNGVFASDLYTMNANGSGVVDLTNTPQAGENFPVFSPLP
jgi:Tol biopolymer transport system component